MFYNIFFSSQNPGRREVRKKMVVRTTVTVTVVVTVMVLMVMAVMATVVRWIVMVMMGR